jgi:hypothetical protein
VSNIYMAALACHSSRGVLLQLPVRLFYLLEIGLVVHNLLWYDQNLDRDIGPCNIKLLHRCVEVYIKKDISTL